jgi:hypothetical protein
MIAGHSIITETTMVVNDAVALIANRFTKGVRSVDFVFSKKDNSNTAIRHIAGTLKSFQLAS